MHKCSTIQTVTTVDSRKTTYTYLQNAQEHKKSGHTTNLLTKLIEKTLR